MEEKIESIYESEGVRFRSQDSKDEVASLEQRRRKLLDEKEVVWILTSRVAWLEQGDENLNIFHQYENCQMG